MDTASKMIKYLVLTSLWLAGALSPAMAQGQLTEASVEQLLVAIEAADERRDADFVLNTLADDVIIVFRYAALGDIPDSRFDKSQYRAYLAEAYAAVEDHSSRRFGTRITLSEDGQQAEVFANVEEITTIQGKTSVHVSQQYVLIQLEGGIPRIKRVFAELVNQGSDT